MNRLLLGAGVQAGVCEPPRVPWLELTFFYGKLEMRMNNGKKKGDVFRKDTKGHGATEETVAPIREVTGGKWKHFEDRVAHKVCSVNQEPRQRSRQIEGVFLGVTSSQLVCFRGQCPLEERSAQGGGCVQWEVRLERELGMGLRSKLQSWFLKKSATLPQPSAVIL